jgi:hypothetical protein
MQYLIKNIDNPWVILFFLLSMAALAHIIWFFYIILKSVNIPFENWRREIEKDIEHTYDIEVLEHMHMVSVKEHEKELSDKKKIESKSARFMALSALFFIITVAYFPYTTIHFPRLKIPYVSNPLFLMYELYIVVLVMFMLSFFLCYRAFIEKNKYEQLVKANIEKGNEYQRYLKKTIFETAIDTRYIMSINMRRNILLLRSKLFGYIGGLFFIITVILSVI